MKFSVLSDRITPSLSVLCEAWHSGGKAFLAVLNNAPVSQQNTSFSHEGGKVLI